MTSEGQYAGSHPAEATSGGPMSDGFPPDSDGQRISGRASTPPPADGFPSSYAPPPQSTPNGGSPFVVPAVRTFGNGSEAAGGSYGSARAPQAEPEGGALPQRGAASPYGSVSPGTAGSPYGSVSPSADRAGDPIGRSNGTAAASPFAPPPRADSPFAPPQPADSPFAPPQRSDSPFAPPPRADSPFAPQAGSASAAGSPFDRSGSPVPASGNAPEAPPASAWAPQSAPTPPESGDIPFPLPQRTPSSVDPATIAEFDGFAAGTPGRGTAGDPPAAEIDPATGRPPGISAFGDQRVRVPGATLADLPDAPAPGHSPRSTDSGGFPARTTGEAPEGGGFPLRSGGASFPTRRSDSGGGFPLRGSSDPSSGGFPLRGPAADPPPDVPGQPVAAMPIRGQQAPFGPPPTPSIPSATSSSFSAFGPPPAAEEPSNAYGEQPDPYGEQPDPSGEQAADPYGRASDGRLADPFGRASGEQAADPYGRASGERPSDPFGPPSGEQAADPFGRRPGADAEPAARGGQSDPFGRTGPEDQPFGGPATSPFGDRPASPAAGSTYGSARPGSPATPYGSDDPEPRTYGAARPASPAGPYGSDAPEPPPAPTYGSARPASLAGYGGDESPSPFFGSPEEPSGSAVPASPAVYGSARPASGDRDPSADPFGRSDSPVYGSTRPSSPAFGDSGESDEHAMYRRPEPADSGGGSGYPQRVPGASLGAPLVAENRSGPVPQPRDPAEHQVPAVGSARPVTASASVPSASRVAPVDPGELPPPAAAPQARVYGRPAARPEAEDDEPPERAEAFGDPAESDRPPFGTPGFGSVAYGIRPNDHDGPGGNSAQGDPGPPGIAPQSPARATARASASARVAPPATPDQPRSEPAFADLTRPAPDGYAPEQYSELTTDIAGREQQPYRPSPAFPPMPPGGGPAEFPGAVSRATVTPPSPDDTTNWPGPANQNRFDAFKPDAAPAKPETPHVRMLPILISVVVGAVLLLGIGFGIVYLVAGGKSEPFTVSTGECVKKDGDAAVKADCGDATAFQVVSIVDDKAKCADPNQPYVLNPTSDGKNQVLCLKPQS